MNLQDISIKYFGVKSTPEYDHYLTNKIFDYCKNSNLFVFQAKSFPEIIFKHFNLLKKKLERFKMSKFHQEKLNYLQTRGLYDYC